MIPSARQHLLETGHSWVDEDRIYADYITEIDLKEFAVKILKYNLTTFKKQRLDFNQGEASKMKSFDEITLETIKELENSDTK